MKEHKKLYKSGKLWMTATVFALAAGTTMATTTAHADATPVNTNATETQNNTDQQKAALQKDIQDKQQQLDDKNNQVTNLQNELDSYKGLVNSEKTGYQNEQDQIKKDAANKTASVDAQINNVQSQLDNAKTDVANTQSQISNTQSQITDLQKDHGTTSTDTNVVSVPNGNLDKSASLLENAARNNLWDNYNDDQQPASSWNGNIIPNNIYVSPDSDKDQEHGATFPGNLTDNYLPYQNDIDQVNESTGMTENQMRELSILLLNEINHARAQRGLAPFVMTEDQFQRAMARAQQDSAANLDHNGNDMNNALGSNWHSENLAMVDADNGTNLLTLLYNANNSVAGMFNNDADSAWGHRNNFLDDGNYNAAFGFRLLDNGFYVMTFDTTYASDADKANDLVANTINNYAAMGPVKASTTAPVDHTNEINKLKKHLSDLNNQLDAQQKTANDLQSQLDSLNGQKAQINSDEQSQLADSTTKHNAKMQDWNNQISTHQTNLSQLKDEIEGLQTAIANDKVALENLNHNGQTPTENQKDNEKYTDLDQTLIKGVEVTEGDTNIPEPSLLPEAIIKDDNANTPATAVFMTLARTSGTYPEGTKVEWANPAKVRQDAQHAGTYDEDVVLVFPDGTKSKVFSVKNALVVNPKKTTPSTDPTTDDSSHTTNPGTTTPTDHNNDGHQDESQPSTPTDHNNAGQNEDQQPSSDQTIPTEDGDDVHSQVAELPTSVKNSKSSSTIQDANKPMMTREAYRAQQATKTLPQTGNESSSALISLGVVGLMSMLGLVSTDKKRG